MNKKSKLIIFLILFASIFLLIFILYIKKADKITTNVINEKNNIVKYISLPDLAINSSEIYIRHRTLSSIFDIFSNELELFSPSLGTFVYNHSNIHKHLSSLSLEESISK